MDDPSQFLQAFMIPESLLYIIAMVPGDPSSSHGFEFPPVTVIAFGCVVLELYLLGCFGIPFLSVVLNMLFGSVHKSLPVFLFLIYLCRVGCALWEVQCLGAPDCCALAMADGSGSLICYKNNLHFGWVFLSMFSKCPTSVGLSFM
ncbi:hypothetical protein V6N13_118713 [Hibiscus sabdariffa]|uniref:Uncharacterized protein n=1 Tax=Hibiscus sabdariffa TaxID=183260 RepID=A0ABR2DZ43_9ROSI